MAAEHSPNWMCLFLLLLLEKHFFKIIGDYSGDKTCVCLKEAILSALTSLTVSLFIISFCRITPFSKEVNL